MLIGVPTEIKETEYRVGMAIQAGARFLEKEAGGRGVLLAGVPGVAAGHVTILGSGTVATNAAQMALGLGARTTILGRNLKKLAGLDALFRAVSPLWP
ncbi:MAG: hypothetical protein PF568_03490 [Deltaproteobacteria bacterium]|jgi:alanine dehydrogenase|nr:hypothetical protein [Deltaproteobacteria bacterium]